MREETWTVLYYHSQRLYISGILIVYTLLSNGLVEFKEQVKNKFLPIQKVCRRREEMVGKPTDQ